MTNTSDTNNFLIVSNDNKILMSKENNPSPDEPPFLEVYNTTYEIKKILYSNFYGLIIIIPFKVENKKIECFGISSKKIEKNIEINEDLFYVNISKTDQGKYLLLNLSANYPKIFLYNLSENKIEKKYYGHIHKDTEGRCSFGGSKDQYILCASEDLAIYLWDRNISGLPKYQFKEHLNIINEVFMINSSTIVSTDDKAIKFFTSYDIEDINFDKKNLNLVKKKI